MSRGWLLIWGLIALASALIHDPRPDAREAVVTLLALIGGGLLVRPFADLPRFAAPTLLLPFLILRYLAVHVAAEVVHGSLRMAAVVLGRRPADPGVVRLQVHEAMDGEVLVVAYGLTLSPDSQVVRIRVEPGVMEAHLLRTADRRRQQERLDRVSRWSRSTEER